MKYAQGGTSFVEQREVKKSKINLFGVALRVVLPTKYTKNGKTVINNSQNKPTQYINKKKEI